MRPPASIKCLRAAMKSVLRRVNVSTRFALKPTMNSHAAALRLTPLVLLFCRSLHFFWAQRLRHSIKEGGVIPVLIKTSLPQLPLIHHHHILQPQIQRIRNQCMTDGNFLQARNIFGKKAQVFQTQVMPGVNA